MARKHIAVVNDDNDAVPCATSEPMAAVYADNSYVPASSVPDVLNGPALLPAR